jgi:4-diphosphocytidyl-2-C-methyl-D-erythritol kinase
MNRKLSGPRRRIDALAPAKINLHLEVLRLRHDGYHEIETVLQAIDLHDRLRVTLLGTYPGGEPEIELKVAPEGAAPDDRTNLCWRAARLFCERLGKSGHLQIELVKEIPTGAGLGGGSSDAMAVLMACDRLFGTGLERRELAALGADIGSDVPFFAAGGTHLGHGRGTELTPLPPVRKVHFVVLKPAFSVDTGSAYRELKMGLTVRAPVASLQVIKPLLARFPRRPWFGYNRLEEVILPGQPELGRMLLRLREETPLAMLSGSGSAIFGVCEQADLAARLVREFAPSVAFARAVDPLGTGARLLGE